MKNNKTKKNRIQSTQKKGERKKSTANGNAGNITAKGSDEKAYDSIEITLMSDLCTGSGYAYAGIIDSDVCYDDCGLPFIPARRLKGCMREAAESLLYTKYTSEDINSLFSEKGSDTGGQFKLGNAYIENYEEIHRFLKAGQADDTASRYCDPQEVLGLYTHVIGQTAMKDGVADSNTLRFTRVINKNAPFDGGPMKFYAKIIIYNKKAAGMLEDIVCATRHIGLKRNRGLGNVKCNLFAKQEKDNGRKAADNGPDERKGLIVLEKSGEYVKIRYAVKNTAPLMISNEQEDESADYIPGQCVLGALAGRYLFGGRRSPDSEEFKDLFLNGNTRFSNLYPWDGRNIYYPAPEYLRRLKKTKKYVYTLQSVLPEQSSLEEDYNYGGGNQPKKLKGKFASLGNDGIAVHEVEKEVIYHHSHKNTHLVSGKERGILYEQIAVSAGQMFAGEIIVPKNEEYLRKIVGLLCRDDLYLGKSRSVQYGRCELVQFRTEKSKDKNQVYTKEEKQDYSKEDDVVVTLLSDVILTDDAGLPAVYRDIAKAALAKELGIQYETGKEEKYISYINLGLASGYHTQWNLRKQPMPCIKAGSCFVYHLKEAITLPVEEWIGERTVEGFGQVRIEKSEKYCYKNNYPQIAARGERSALEFDSAAGVDIITDIAIKLWLNGKIEAILRSGELSVISNSSVGRMNLMLTESLAAKKDPDEAFKDFTERIMSIKTDETRNAGESLLKLVGNPDKGWTIDEGGEFINNFKDNEPDFLVNTVEVSRETVRKKMINCWGDYIRAILMDRKYNGKAEA